jgi:hypothetical protein
MKMFILFSVLALLFIIGSAMALTAIGRNTPAKKTEDEGKETKYDKGN